MSRLDGLRPRSPRLERFLRSQERPWPVLREVTMFVVVLVVAATMLWGFTGQPFPHRPIVVVESGSMMHCKGYAHAGQEGDNCPAASYGRLGTIDPGDLVFVSHVSSVSQVTTCLSGGTYHPAVGSIPARMSCGPGGKYGHGGDVLVYRHDDQSAVAPIIHRAIFYLQINEHPDGKLTFTIPELGALGKDLTTLTNLPTLDEGDGVLLRNLGLDAQNPTSDYGLFLQQQHVGAEASGFIMLGDNNPFADQGPGNSISVLPARLDWVLGKARGEVPWVGLVNLGFQQLRGSSDHWYSRSPGDVKVMFYVTVAAILVVPWGITNLVRLARRGKGKPEAEAGPDGPGNAPKPPSS